MSHEKVLLIMPTIDHKLWVHNVSSMIPVIAGRFAIPYFHIGQSNVRLARNECAHYFLNHTDCDSSLWVDADIEYTMQDFAYMMEGDEELVIAPYAKKSLGQPPVDFGMGFVRIDRTVFEKLAAWTDDTGQEMLNRFRHEGEIAVDFFFDGASQDMRWFSEDTGFFHWCSLIDGDLKINVRRELRTRLRHWGYLPYGYPEQISGMVSVGEAAQ